jgi:hypothetical protein
MIEELELIRHSVENGHPMNDVAVSKKTLKELLRCHDLWQSYIKNCPELKPAIPQIIKREDWDLHDHPSIQQILDGINQERFHREYRCEFIDNSMNDDYEGGTD